MKKTFTILFLILINIAKSQEQYQYFDNLDTFSYDTLQIHFGTDTIDNIWQIGVPQKIIFDSAATVPNAIVTDTINSYPNNDSSSFIVHVDTEIYNQDWFYSVFAFQWMQKLDFDTIYDGGKIEVSVDSGLTWTNVLNDPYVYNFYGYKPENLDTLHNGEDFFTGTDSTWRNIWLCYDFSWMSLQTSIDFKFSIATDSIDNNKEGWILDNFSMHPTVVHTLVEQEQEEYIKIYPNPTTDRLHINLKRQKGFHIIEKMQVFSSVGKVIDEFENIPVKFFIDTKHYKKGTYFLKIQSNIQTNTIKFVVSE